VWPILALGAGLGALVNLGVGLLLFPSPGSVLGYALLGGLLGLALAGMEVRLRRVRARREEGDGERL